MIDKSMKTLKDTIASLDRLLNSPSFSESQKAQARKLKEQLSNELKRLENQKSQWTQENDYLSELKAARDHVPV